MSTELTVDELLAFRTSLPRDISHLETLESSGEKCEVPADEEIVHPCPKDMSRIEAAICELKKS